MTHPGDAPGSPESTTEPGSPAFLPPTAPQLPPTDGPCAWCGRRALLWTMQTSLAFPACSRCAKLWFENDGASPHGRPPLRAWDFEAFAWLRGEPLTAALEAATKSPAPPGDRRDQAAREARDRIASKLQIQPKAVASLDRDIAIAMAKEMRKPPG